MPLYYPPVIAAVSEHPKHTPASGPLHWLFPPGMLAPSSLHGSLFQLCIQVSFFGIPSLIILSKILNHSPNISYLLFFPSILTALLPIVHCIHLSCSSCIHVSFLTAGIWGYSAYGSIARALERARQTVGIRKSLLSGAGEDPTGLPG